MKQPTRGKNHKLKAVIFIGANLGDGDFETKKMYLINQFGEENLDFQIITDEFDEINLSSLNLKKSTNKDTIFIFWSHGVNNPDPNYKFHIIDNVRTGKFLKNLKKELGHGFEAVLFACQGGGALKHNEIDNEISLMTRSGSKYSTTAHKNLEQILKILSLKKRGLTNKEIFVELPKLDPETFYCRDKDRKKTFKLPRIGKFTVKDINNLLEDCGLEPYQKDAILLALDLSGKKDFSIEGIKKRIYKLGFDEKEEKSNEGIYDQFIRKLEANLQEKISPEAIKSFIKNRGENLFKSDKVTKTAEPKSETSDDDQAKIYIYELLLLAVSRGDCDLTKAIISKYGKNIIDETERHLFHGQMTLLNFAILDQEREYLLGYRNIEIIKTLIACGADLNQHDSNGINPIKATLVRDDLELLQILIGKGADPHLPDDRRVTPLEFAIAQGGGPKTLGALINNYGVKSSDYQNLLQTAVVLQRPKEIIDILTGAGAKMEDIYSKNHEDRIFLAIKAGDLNAVIQFIKETTFSNRFKIGYSTMLIESTLAIASKNGYVEILEKLLESGDGFFINTQVEPNGETALSLAVAGNHTETVSMLVANKIAVQASPEYKINTNIANKQGRTPLMIAAKNGNKEITELLTSDKTTDLDLVDQKGRTAFMLAVKNNEKEVVRLLIERGADIDKPDINGLTPLKLANNNELTTIAAMIKEAQNSRSTLGKLKKNLASISHPKNNEKPKSSPQIPEAEGMEEKSEDKGINN